ncbi:hypothetical protein B0H14DRAFT_3452059 [Mycena olivaceomarginata]|nr:hypothetical protein B0H14DRAFT_3452059 [Mycena olivaceomarginata]
MEFCSVVENLEYTAAWNAALQTQDIPESIAAARERRVPRFAALRSKGAKL